MIFRIFIFLCLDCIAGLCAVTNPIVDGVFVGIILGAFLMWICAEGEKRQPRRARRS